MCIRDRYSSEFMYCASVDAVQKCGLQDKCRTPLTTESSGEIDLIETESNAFIHMFIRLSDIIKLHGKGDLRTTCCAILMSFNNVR